MTNDRDAVLSCIKGYYGVKKGVYAFCRSCGRVMVLPHGSDRCPECGCSSCHELSVAEDSEINRLSVGVNREYYGHISTLDVLSEASVMYGGKLVRVCKDCGLPVCLEDDDMSVYDDVVDEPVYSCPFCGESMLEHETKEVTGRELRTALARTVRQSIRHIEGMYGTNGFVLPFGVEIPAKDYWLEATEVVNGKGTMYNFCIKGRRIVRDDKEEYVSKGKEIFLPDKDISLHGLYNLCRSLKEVEIEEQANEYEQQTSIAV